MLVRRVAADGGPKGCLSPGLYELCTLRRQVLYYCTCAWTRQSRCSPKSEAIRSRRCAANGRPAARLSTAPVSTSRQYKPPRPSSPMTSRPTGRPPDFRSRNVYQNASGTLEFSKSAPTIPNISAARHCRAANDRALYLRILRVGVEQMAADPHERVAPSGGSILEMMRGIAPTIHDSGHMAALINGANALANKPPTGAVAAPQTKASCSSAPVTSPRFNTVTTIALTIPPTTMVMPAFITLKAPV